MSKKIKIFMSSPVKDGNTAALADWVAQAAKEKGAQVEIVNVARLKYKVNGCIACMGCQKSEKYECVIEDEARPILASIPNQDIVIFATPLYFFGPSAQLKLFMDRMYSLFKFNPESGEYKHNLKHLRFGLIASAGGENLGLLEKTFQTICGFVGGKLESLIIPLAGRSGDIKLNAQAKEKAIAFGQGLAS